MWADPAGQQHTVLVGIDELSPAATGRRAAQPPAETEQTPTCRADVRRLPVTVCAAGITLSKSTHGRVKKKTTLGHILCSMPSSCAAVRRGQWLFFKSIIRCCTLARFPTSSKDLVRRQRPVASNIDTFKQSMVCCKKNIFIW